MGSCVKGVIWERVGGVGGGPDVRMGEGLAGVDISFDGC